MAGLRMWALIACMSRRGDVRRPLTRLMASAFSSPGYAPTSRPTSRRVRPLPFASPFGSRGHTFNSAESSVSSVPPRCPQRRAHLVYTQLYSTTSNDDLAAATDIIEVDPYSDQARDDLAKFYEQNGIEADIDVAHKSLLRLTEQVLSWNQKLNLVSRKDCTAPVVYHRHVLPSVALLPLILERCGEEGDQLNIVDVGTGGGFPGLPLALLLPEAQFTLVDSVQKKLVAVSEMAAEMDVTNVRIHWGRVEAMCEGDKGRTEHRGRYDVVLGRSVTALPRFCGWVADLLKGNGNIGKEVMEEEGRLIYIIGGELDDIVESRIMRDLPLDELLQRAEGTSDKRALIFNARDVEEIATESGEKQKIVRSGPGRKGRRQNNKGGKKMAKGAWSKKQNDVKKERGYDDFQRYEF